MNARDSNKKKMVSESKDSKTPVIILEKNDGSQLIREKSTDQSGI